MKGSILAGIVPVWEGRAGRGRTTFAAHDGECKARFSTPVRKPLLAALRALSLLGLVGFAASEAAWGACDWSVFSGSGNWSVSDNWNPKSVPGDDSDVYVSFAASSVTGDRTVDIDSSTTKRVGLLVFYNNNGYKTTLDGESAHTLLFKKPDSAYTRRVWIKSTGTSWFKNLTLAFLYYSSASAYRSQVVMAGKNIGFENVTVNTSSGYVPPKLTYYNLQGTENENLTFKDSVMTIDDWYSSDNSKTRNVAINNSLLTVKSMSNKATTAEATVTSGWTDKMAYTVTLGSKNTSSSAAALVVQNTMTVASGSTLTIDANGKGAGTYKILSAGTLTGAENLKCSLKNGNATIIAAGNDTTVSALSTAKTATSGGKKYTLSSSDSKSVTLKIENTTCTVTLNGGTGVDKIYYRQGTSENWTQYSAAFTVNPGTTVQYYSTPKTNYTSDQTQSSPGSVTVNADKTITLTAKLTGGDISGATVTVSPTSATYTGSVIANPTVTVTLQGCDITSHCRCTWDDTLKNLGVYHLTVTARQDEPGYTFTGTATAHPTFTIKSANMPTLKGKAWKHNVQDGRWAATTSWDGGVVPTTDFGEFRDLDDKTTVNVDANATVNGIKFYNTAPLTMYITKKLTVNGTGNSQGNPWYDCDGTLAVGTSDSTGYKAAPVTMVIDGSANANAQIYLSPAQSMHALIFGKDSVAGSGNESRLKFVVPASGWTTMKNAAIAVDEAKDDSPTIMSTGAYFEVDATRMAPNQASYLFYALNGARIVTYSGENPTHMAYTQLNAEQIQTWTKSDRFIIDTPENCRGVVEFVNASGNLPSGGEKAVAMKLTLVPATDIANAVVTLSKGAASYTGSAVEKPTLVSVTLGGVDITDQCYISGWKNAAGEEVNNLIAAGEYYPVVRAKLSSELYCGVVANPPAFRIVSAYYHKSGTTDWTTVSSWYMNEALTQAATAYPDNYDAGVFVYSSGSAVNAVSGGTTASRKVKLVSLKGGSGDSSLAAVYSTKLLAKLDEDSEVVSCETGVTALHDVRFEVDPDSASGATPSIEVKSGATLYADSMSASNVKLELAAGSTLRLFQGLSSYGAGSGTASTFGAFSGGAAGQTTTMKVENNTATFSGASGVSGKLDLQLTPGANNTTANTMLTISGAFTVGSGSTLKVDASAKTTAGTYPLVRATSFGGMTAAQLAGAATVTQPSDNHFAKVVANGTTGLDLVVYNTVAKPTVTTSFTYDGSQKTAGSAATGYAVSGDKATNAGDYTFKATLKSGYCWADDHSTSDYSVGWKINKANDSVTKPTMAGWKYGESASSPSGSTCTSGTTITYKYYQSDGTTLIGPDRPSTPGTYVVKAHSAGNSNYNAGVSEGVSFTISNGTISYTATGYSAAYDGSAHGISVTVTAPSSGATIKYGTASGTYDKDTSPTRTNVGTTTVYYQITAANYTTVTGSQTINITRATATEPTVNTGLTYTGSSQSGVKTSGSGVKLGGTQSATNADSYSFTATPDSNHQWSGGGTDAKTYNWSIAAKEVTLTWGTTTSWTYDGESHVPSCTASGLATGDTCTVTVSGAQTNVGSYTATASGLSNANYKLPTSGLTKGFTITAKSIADVTMTVTNDKWWWDNAAHVPTIAFDPALTEGVDYTLSATNSSGTAVTYATGMKSVGTYGVRVTGKGNYSGTMDDFTFTISRPTLTWKDTNGTNGTGAWTDAWNKPNKTGYANNNASYAGTAYPSAISQAGTITAASGKSVDLTLGSKTQTVYSLTDSSAGSARVHDGTLTLGSNVTKSGAGQTTFENVTFQSNGSSVRSVYGSVANTTIDFVGSNTIGVSGKPVRLRYYSKSGSVYEGQTFRFKDGQTTLGDLIQVDNYGERPGNLALDNATLTGTAFDTTTPSLTLGMSMNLGANNTTANTALNFSGTFKISAGSTLTVDASAKGAGTYQLIRAGTLTVADGLDAWIAAQQANVTPKAGTTATLVKTADSKGIDLIVYDPTVTLDKQGGTGGSDSVTVTYGADIPKIETPKKTGYAFEGYYAQPGGNGIRYIGSGGDSRHVWDQYDTTTLYANWLKNIDYKRENYTGAYDGLPHGITLEVIDPADASIKYGTVSGTYDLDEPPTLTEVGTMTVYYKIEKAGYGTVSSSKTITITKGSNTFTEGPTISGWTYGSSPSTPSATPKFGGAITYKYYSDSACTTEITPSSTTAAGTYYLKATSEGTSNYDAVTSEAVLFTVGNADLTGVLVTQKNALTYNGATQVATVTTAATAKGSQTVTFTYSATSGGTYGSTVPAVGPDAGEYTVYYKATAANHNEKTGSFTVTIGQKSIKDGTAKDLYYRGYGYGEEEVPFSVGGIQLDPETEYSAEFVGVVDEDGNITGIGTYSVRFTGESNYTGTCTCEVKILKNVFTWNTDNNGDWTGENWMCNAEQEEPGWMEANERQYPNGVEFEVNILRQVTVTVDTYVDCRLLTLDNSAGLVCAGDPLLAQEILFNGTASGTQTYVMEDVIIINNGYGSVKNLVLTVGTAGEGGSGANATVKFTGDCSFDSYDGLAYLQFYDGSANCKFLFKDCEAYISGGITVDRQTSTAMVARNLEFNNALVSTTSCGCDDDRDPFCFNFTLGDNNEDDGTPALELSDTLYLRRDSTLTVDAGGKSAGTYPLVRAGTVNVSEITLDQFIATAGTVSGTKSGTYAKVVATSDGKGLDLVVYNTVAKPTISTTSVTYTGSDFKSLVTPASPTGYAYDWTGDWTTVGTHSVTATLSEGYCWPDGTTDPVKLTLTVTAKTAAFTIADIPAETYNGNEHRPTPVVKDGDKTLTLGTDYTLSYENNVNAGTAAKVKVTGKGNYAGSTASKTFTINKAQRPIPTAKTGLVYNGDYQLCVDNGPSSATDDPYVSYTGNAYGLVGSSKDSGDPTHPTYSLKDPANYEWTDGTTADITVKWTIAQKPVTLTWGATTRWMYDGERHVPTCQIGGVIESDDYDCMLIVEGSQTDVGDYEAEAKLTGSKSYCYQLPASGTTQAFTIWWREYATGFGTQKVHVPDEWVKAWSGVSEITDANFDEINAAMHTANAHGVMPWQAYVAGFDAATVKAGNAAAIVDSMHLVSKSEVGMMTLHYRDWPTTPKLSTSSPKLSNVKSLTYVLKVGTTPDDLQDAQGCTQYDALPKFDVPVPHVQTGIEGKVRCYEIQMKFTFD